MCENPAVLFLVPDCFKAEGMGIKDVEVDPWQLYNVPDYFKTQEMCHDAVWGDPFSLKSVPDWFVTQQQLKTWDDYDGYFNYDELIKWYDDYKKRKVQKAKIKDELMPIAWNPSRWWDWCMSEDEKRWWK